MKCLVVGNFGHGWEGSICDERNISNALRDLGWEVKEVQRENLAIASGEYDFALIAQWGNYPSDIISLLKKYAKTVIYWAFDYHHLTKHDWHYRMASEADIFISKEIAHRNDYGDNFHWLPQDFAPYFLDKTETVKDIDVLFTGSYLPHAKERIDSVLSVDNIVVHSVTADAWKNAGVKDSRGPKMDYELPILYARSKIVLSVDHVISEGYWSDRNAQIMVCGGFPLFWYVPQSEVVFGDNIGYFYNLEELPEKIDYWLNHDEEREEVAKRGYIHAKNNLTVTKRVKDMLRIYENWRI